MPFTDDNSDAPYEGGATIQMTTLTDSFHEKEGSTRPITPCLLCKRERERESIEVEA